MKKYEEPVKQRSRYKKDGTRVSPNSVEDYFKSARLTPEQWEKRDKRQALWNIVMGVLMFAITAIVVCWLVCMFMEGVMFK